MTTRSFYRSQSRVYRTQADEELAKGDLCQASEKGWGAAAEMVKAAADERDLTHDTHRDLFLAVNRLAAETGDMDLPMLFQTANGLHRNFYEGWLERDTVERSLGQVTELVTRVEGLLRSQ